jgi:hypothetical protein
VKKRRKRAKGQQLMHPNEPHDLPIGMLLEVLCALHLSSYVESPFVDRSGIMIVGPPGVLKSTIVSLLDGNYNDVVKVSDINARSLNELRDQIAAQSIRTMIVPEYKKLWDRHPYTAANVEGTIQALVGEGFSSASYEPQRINRLRARVTFLSAMTPKFQTDHFNTWEESGFSRRFLWSLVRLKDPELLDKAVEDWRLVDFGIAHIPPIPTPSSIPNLTTKEERADLRKLVKFQPGAGSHAAQTALLAKMLAVLKWWYRLMKRKDSAAMLTLRTFATSLGKEGADLVI